MRRKKSTPSLEWSDGEIADLGHTLMTAVVTAPRKERETGTCKHCEIKFWVYGLGQKFCSLSCRNKYHYQQRKRDLKEFKRLKDEWNNAAQPPVRLQRPP